MTIRTLLLVSSLAASPAALAASGELKAAAARISHAHRDSVVWISVIVKTSLSVDGDAPAQIKAALAGQDKEAKQETTGTVIDASGLIVTALFGIDKSALVDGRTVQTPMGVIKLKSESEIKEVKVITADGSEIPADLVLKDADLGLAFIRVRADSPEAEGVTFTAIDLAASRHGELLDDAISLGRLNEDFNREPSVVTTEVSGITSRPRTYFRVLTDSVGTPVFLADGKLLGLTVVRPPKGDLDAGSTQILPVVLPAADVARIAEQAKTAEPVTTSPEEKAPEDESSDEEKPAEEAEAPEAAGEKEE